MEAEAVIAGRYRLLHRIARGGQAVVYLARQLHLEREVALKVLTTAVGDQGEDLDSFTRRFLIEAQTLATLNHPHIVTVYDYGQTDDGNFGDDAFFIAMEYVRGVHFDRLCEGPMAPPRARRLIRQVCLALSYAHSKGVIHRDIKNSNVLVYNNNGVEQIKLVDFGIAKLTEENIDLTRTGAIIGSPKFMAPEQILGQPVDHRTDIYAVGMLLYVALAGKYPFNLKSPQSCIYEHLNREPAPFSETAPDADISLNLEGIVLRCLRKTPEERYASVDDLLAALDMLDDTDLVSASTPPPPRRMAQRLLLLAALPIAALFLVIAGLIAYPLFFMPMQHTPPTETTTALNIPSEPPSVTRARTDTAQPDAEDDANDITTASKDESTAEAAPQPAAPQPVVSKPVVSAPKAAVSRQPERAPVAKPVAKPTSPPLEPAPEPVDGFSIGNNDIRDPWKE